MTALCPHDDSPHSCPPCLRERGHAEFEVRPAKRMTSESAKSGTRMDARFKSQCPRCMRLIREGDPIIMSSAGWVCEGLCDDES